MSRGTDSASRFCPTPRTVLLTLLISLFAAAPAGATINNFDAADGNQACASGTVDTDWACLTTPITRIDDGVGNADTTTFKDGKEEQPSTWTYATGAGTANAKTDVRAIWKSIVEKDDGSSYLYLAFKREGNDGQAFFSFELNQLRQTETNPLGTVVPCRADGDVLLSYEIQSTGSPVALHVYRWAGDTSTPCSDGTWEPVTTTVNPEGAINATASLTNALSGVPEEPVFDASTFGEAAVDLQGIAGSLGLPRSCEYFTSLRAHSRQSNSFTSSMEDLVDGGTLSLLACQPPDGGNPDPPAAPTITAPAACNPSSTVDLGGGAPDIAGLQVLVRENDVTQAIADADAGSWSATLLDQADGSHSYTARSVDQGVFSETDSSAVSVLVDGSPDAPATIGAPADGASIAAGTATVSGTAEPGSIVTVRRDGAIVGTATASDAGAWSLNVALAAGDHTLSAAADDGCNADTRAATALVHATSGGGVDSTSTDSNVTPTTSGNPLPQQGVADDALGGVPKGCATRRFSVFVADKAKKMKKVVFRVDGKKVKTDRTRDHNGNFVVFVNPKKYKVGKHKVSATITYRDAATPKKTIKKRWRHCETCASRRAFYIHVQSHKADPVAGAQIKVAGKRVKVVEHNGRFRARVVLHGLPKGEVKVRIRATLRSGKVVTGTRKYHTCGPKRPKHKGPRL